MTKELWATYSVIDHLQPRYLALDVMLFDRLVFPVPQKPRIDGDPTQFGDVIWESDSAALEHWEDWDPEAQEKVLDALKPVLRKVHWGPESAQSRSFKKEAASLADRSLPDDAFRATRTELTRDLPAHVDGVAAMGPAFRSFAEAEKTLGLHDIGMTRALPGGALSLSLGWEFIAPDLTQEGIDDLNLLKETVAFVTGDSQFRERRTDFIEFQTNFLRSGETDVEAVKKAIEEMKGLISEVQDASRRLPLRPFALDVCKLVPVATGLGVALASGVGVPLATTAAVCWFAGLCVGKWPTEEPQRNNDPSAFILDARQHFARAIANRH
ncbi:hypothetical protein D1BOALGB6SA_243 [Olavius sp. associated proteobacterium Delta 1]|nr:hypothetical protein D1BOALGB6SA_243 [Olavius sp. associated proteobacterium Delta 1]